MFCMKCGHKLEDGAVFCTQCGSRVPRVSQPAQSTMYTGGAPQPQKKSRKGLIIALSVGGALVIAAVLLAVLLPGGNAGLAGTWYDETGYGGTVAFRANGTFDMQVAGMNVSGTYTFDEKKSTGKLSASFMGGSEKIPFKLGKDRLNIDGVWYTKTYVEQFDYSDMLDEYGDMFGDFPTDDFFN